MPLTQAHYLLMLAEDIRDKGDELSNEYRQRAAAHHREIYEVSALIEQAREVIEREKARFQQFAPGTAAGSQTPAGQGLSSGLPPHLIRQQAPPQKKAAE
jgi:hypothetical protein